jgi:hypothetical protein
MTHLPQPNLVISKDKYASNGNTVPGSSKNTAEAPLPPTSIIPSAPSRNFPQSIISEADSSVSELPSRNYANPQSRVHSALASHPAVWEMAEQGSHNIIPAASSVPQNHAIRDPTMSIMPSESISQIMVPQTLFVEPTPHETYDSYNSTGNKYTACDEHIPYQSIDPTDSVPQRNDFTAQKTQSPLPLTELVSTPAQAPLSAMTSFKSRDYPMPLIEDGSITNSMRQSNEVEEASTALGKREYAQDRSSSFMGRSSFPIYMAPEFAARDGLQE